MDIHGRDINVAVLGCSSGYSQQVIAGSGTYGQDQRRTCGRVIEADHQLQRRRAHCFRLCIRMGARTGQTNRGTAHGNGTGHTEPQANKRGVRVVFGSTRADRGSRPQEESTSGREREVEIIGVDGREDETVNKRQKHTRIVPHRRLCTGAASLLQPASIALALVHRGKIDTHVCRRYRGDSPFRMACN